MRRPMILVAVAMLLITTPSWGNAQKRVVIVTGQDYPGHEWQETAPVLAGLLREDARLHVDVVEDPKFLASPDLDSCDTIVLHFMDWEVPDPGTEARANLEQVVKAGKGLVLVHFACGAFQEWPQFRDLVGRVWDPRLRGHDPHGTFRVTMVDPDHPTTQGMSSFETTDELYTCLTGDAAIQVVASARSTVDEKEYPMAFVLEYGQGRVFHSVLGHDVQAFAAPGVGELYRRGCAWTAGLQPAATRKKVVLIAGKNSHGEGEHAHTAGVMLLKQCLETSPNVAGMDVEVVLNGWPEDPSTLDDADTILVYADGFGGHPLFSKPERLKQIRGLMARGTGLVCLHYAVAPPKNAESEALFLDWLGGYYKDGYSKNPMNEPDITPATPEHPICRGLKPYSTRDEFYYHNMFGENDERVTPIISAMLPKDDPKPESLAWAVERADGGRGFGFTGGHFHKNWQVEPFRKMVLNAILWTAMMEVPDVGVVSTVK